MNITSLIRLIKPMKRSNQGIVVRSNTVLLSYSSSREKYWIDKEVNNDNNIDTNNQIMSVGM